MNYLEEVARVVKSKPQLLWFKERYTPLMSMIVKLVEDGEISYNEIHSPLLDMMCTSMYTFRYEGNRYLLSFAKVGKVVDWYKLEKISPYSSSLRGEMVSSSDDDPNQESFMENLSMMLDAKTPSELYRKLENF